MLSAVSDGSSLAVWVKDLEKRFGSFTAVNRISFEVARGEVFGFLGPNGAGKTTTIRMLCGILRPTGGSGQVAGIDIIREPEKIKAHIGYMSQKFSLYEDLTVEQNIDFYAGIYAIPPDKRRQRKEWVIEMAGLKEHRHTLTSVLSAGWRQRLSLGCAIMHEPPIIFLDEPTSGVDPISRRQFWELIYELSSRGTTVFVTTHYMDEAEYCDRLALIHGGKIVAMGTPGELKKDFMDYDVFDVACDRPQEAMAELETLEGVREVALFGKGLHVVSEKNRDMEEKLGETLRAKGHKVEKVERISPSLEDVFVYLIERTRGLQEEGLGANS